MDTRTHEHTRSCACLYRYSFGKPDVRCDFKPEEAAFAADVGHSLLKQLALGNAPNPTISNNGGKWPTCSGAVAGGNAEIVLTLPEDSSHGYRVQQSRSTARCAMWRDIWSTRRHKASNIAAE